VRRILCFFGWHAWYRLTYTHYDDPFWGVGVKRAVYRCKRKGCKARIEVKV